MPGLDRIWQLDVASPVSNSNYQSANVAEGGPPSAINNALRALGSMITQEIAYQGPAISASVSTNLCTATSGLFQAVVGSGAINSFGTVPSPQTSAAVLRFLEFSSSASLSHGGAIRLIGGVSRRTQPGDIGGYIHCGAADVWHEFLYSRADGSQLTGSISATTLTAGSISASAISAVTLNAASLSATAIALTGVTSISASVGDFTILKIGGSSLSSAVAQVVVATNSTYTTLGTILPCDNTIPQNTEGDEVLSVTITPTNASSTLLITFTGFIGGSTNQNMTAALFVDSAANALAATTANTVNVALTLTVNLSLQHAVTAGSTSARTYKIRCGAGAATDAFLNGDSSSRLFGGVAAAILKVEEILP